MPFVPGAVGIAVLEPPDQRERRTLEAPAGTELQRRMVVEQLGALADLAQRSTFTDDRAAAEAADRERRRRRAELDRCAAVRTGGAVGALGRRVGGQRSGQRRGPDRTSRLILPNRNLGPVNATGGHALVAGRSQGKARARPCAYGTQRARNAALRPAGDLP